jgi:hypothetical protein
MTNLDKCTAERSDDAELQADEVRTRLPVLLAADLERLRGLDDLTLYTVLDTAGYRPGCRVVDALRSEGEK